MRTMAIALSILLGAGGVQVSMAQEDAGRTAPATTLSPKLLQLAGADVGRRLERAAALGDAPGHLQPEGVSEPMQLAERLFERRLVDVGQLDAAQDGSLGFLSTVGEVCVG